MPGKAPIMEYFQYDHLPPHLQEVSKPICECAEEMDKSLPNGAEKSAGLRKLLEAKDCFVRAALPRKETPPPRSPGQPFEYLGKEINRGE